MPLVYKKRLHFPYRKYLDNNEDTDNIILMMNLKNILYNT